MRAEHVLLAVEQVIDFLQEVPRVLAPGGLDGVMRRLVGREATGALDMGEGRVYGARQISHVRQRAGERQRIVGQQLRPRI